MGWIRDGLEDVRYACRRLLRDTHATAAAVGVLACGIALSVAIFTIADTVLRRPLPLLDQQRILVLWEEAPGSMRTLPLGRQHFERFRKESRALEEVAGTLSIDSVGQSVRDGDQSFPISL